MQNRTNIRKTGILRSLSLIVYQQFDVLRIAQDTHFRIWREFLVISRFLSNWVKLIGFVLNDLNWIAFNRIENRALNAFFSDAYSKYIIWSWYARQWYIIIYMPYMFYMMIIKSWVKIMIFRSFLIKTSSVIDQFR